MNSGNKLILLIVFCIFALVAKAQTYDFIVATDGTGNFTKVQDAIDAVPDFRKAETTIYIKNGVYKEKITLAPTKTHVRMIGQSADSTILTFDDFADRPNRFGEKMGTTSSSSFFLMGDYFVAENISFANSAGPVGQAVAGRVDGDKVAFIGCKFLGFQDTLYPHGEQSKQYYRNCTIEGTVDFIFGWSTAVFDSCTIVCKEKGYITAASTNEGTKHGFVFLDSKITGPAENESFYLGRPWRPFSKVAFLRCELGKMIKPEGWHNWDKPEAETSSFYAEYRCTGPGINPKKRVKWSHELTPEQAAKYTPHEILGEWVDAYTK